MRERSFSDIVSTLEKIAQWKRFQNNSGLLSVHFYITHEAKKSAEYCPQRNGWRGVVSGLCNLQPLYKEEEGRMKLICDSM